MKIGKQHANIEYIYVYLFVFSLLLNTWNHGRVIEAHFSVACERACVYVRKTNQALQWNNILAKIESEWVFSMAITASLGAQTHNKYTNKLL